MLIEKNNNLKIEYFKESLEKDENDIPKMHESCELQCIFVDDWNIGSIVRFLPGFIPIGEDYTNPKYYEYHILGEKKTEEYKEMLNIYFTEKQLATETLVLLHERKMDKKIEKLRLLLPDSFKI